MNCPEMHIPPNSTNPRAYNLKRPVPGLRPFYLIPDRITGPQHRFVGVETVNRNFHHPCAVRILDIPTCLLDFNSILTVPWSMCIRLAGQVKRKRKGRVREKEMEIKKKKTESSTFITYPASFYIIPGEKRRGSKIANPNQSSDPGAATHPPRSARPCPRAHSGSARCSRPSSWTWPAPWRRRWRATTPARG